VCNFKNKKLMAKLNYLNVGCGNKFHKDWINVDMTSNSTDVISANLLNGIPFPDESFDVVYHSQVLEHFPKEKAQDFIKECFRVLKYDGILRVVVPDLENIVDEYKKFLNENIENSNDLSAANYDWIMLEMYDQTVRNYSGGQMAEFIKQPYMINEEYVMGRIGFVGRSIRNSLSSKHTGNVLLDKFKKGFSSVMLFKKAVNHILKKIIYKQMSEISKIGAFRLGGEIHMWMYDRYSLPRLLKNCGFEEVSIKSPVESDIPKWEEYELDIKDGLVYDPTSLFVEAKKKRI
jgi:predicted SAM-dependent methyltransferase